MAITKVSSDMAQDSLRKVQIIQAINEPIVLQLPLTLKAEQDYELTRVTHLLSAGTCTFRLLVDGAEVTEFGSISPTGVITTATPSGTVTVSADSILTLDITAVSSPGLLTLDIGGLIV